MLRAGKMTTMPPEAPYFTHAPDSGSPTSRSENNPSKDPDGYYVSSTIDAFSAWNSSSVQADLSNVLKFTVITAIPPQCSIPTFWHHALKTQTYRNWEHIALEFGGINSKATWNSGSHRTHVSKPTDPIYSRTEAINKGLSLALGDVIAFLPLNCTYKHEGVLSKVAECMLDPEVDLVFGNLECVSRNSAARVMKPGIAGLSCLEMLQNGLLPFEECVFVRRDWWQFFGGLETSYQYSAGMARLLDLLSQPGLQARYLDEVLIRSHRKAESNSTNLARLLEDVTIFSKRKRLATYLTHRSLYQRPTCD